MSQIIFTKAKIEVRILNETIVKHFFLGTEELLFEKETEFFIHELNVKAKTAGEIQTFSLCNVPVVELSTTYDTIKTNGYKNLKLLNKWGLKFKFMTPEKAKLESKSLRDLFKAGDELNSIYLEQM